MQGLKRWAALVKPGVPIIVVATKSDALRVEDDHAALHASLRRFCLAHQQAGLVFTSVTRGTNCATLKSYVEHVLFPKQITMPAPLDSLVEVVSHDALFIPLQWDKASNFEGEGGGGADNATVVEAAQEPATTASPRPHKDEEVVVAEMEQAFLLRHMKILEATAAEDPQPQQYHPPSTPQSGTLDISSSSLPASTATTPLKTPSRASSVATPSFQTPTTPVPAPSVEDTAELANFFNSLISKDKSPYKGPKK